MRRSALHVLPLAFALLLALITVSAAQATCTCPWEVRQLDSTQSPGDDSDCPLLYHEGQTNAGFWADNACAGRGGACTYTYTPLSCTANPDGSETASGLLNYKCNQC
jgi:hypothetical protein